jgi:hypothetical protein
LIQIDAIHVQRVVTAAGAWVVQNGLR